MVQVLLDTSFLITFASPDRAQHAVAVDYFNHCRTRRIPMFLSTVAAGEFAVRQALDLLPLLNFQILPYNLPHAIKAAELSQAKTEVSGAGAGDKRAIIINDLKLIAQAEDEQIGIILTEDENTLSRLCQRLRQAGRIRTQCLLLKDGFAPGRLENPDQPELGLRA